MHGKDKQALIRSIVSKQKDRKHKDAEGEHQKRSEEKRLQDGIIDTVRRRNPSCGVKQGG